MGELLPTYSRVLTFRLTARDNVAGGGGVGNDSVNVTVTDAAGPFLVTAPNTAVSWTGGASENVTWDVSNTDTSSVNCNAADVLFSTDGGSTFPVPLASGTANDGLHAIMVPNVTTSTARMKVQCSDNIFFDLSNANFNVSAVAGCLEDQILVDRSIAGVQTFEGGTTLSAYAFVVQGTGNVTFQAPAIALGEGFEVQSGGTFTAEIVAGPCP